MLFGEGEVPPEPLRWWMRFWNHGGTRINTDGFWVDDSLSGVIVSGDALAAGCDLPISLLRLFFEPRMNTDLHGWMRVFLIHERHERHETWMCFVGGRGLGGRGSTRAANLDATAGLWVGKHGGGGTRGEERGTRAEC